jgi:hypothetical protein
MVLDRLEIHSSVMKHMTQEQTKSGDKLCHGNHEIDLLCFSASNYVAFGFGWLAATLKNFGSLLTRYQTSTITTANNVFTSSLNCATM